MSCNYFFYDIGRRTGISTIARYASAFGLGEPTGIEIPEKIGVMTTPDYVNSLDGHYWTDGQTLTTAIGQSYSLFTPLQLANYVAALAGGGTRYNAHLLKEVRTYDSAELVDVYDKPPTEIIDIEPENLQAVLQGMRDLVVSGSVAYYFKDCVVDAAAKTGTAQTGQYDENGEELLNYWFSGFYPAQAPRYTVTVLQDGILKPELSSAAIFEKITEILHVWDAAL